MEEEDDLIFQIVSLLETHRDNQDPESMLPIPLNVLMELHSFIQQIRSVNNLLEQMSSRNLAPSLLINLLISSMDSSGNSIALLASQVYLSLLVKPNSPIYTLFKPMAFLSLLRTLRRSLKLRKVNNSYQTDILVEDKTNRKRKNGGRCRISRGNDDPTELASMFTVLEGLKMVLEKIGLSGFLDTVKSLIETVTEILMKSMEFHEDGVSFERVSGICFDILRSMLRPDHGDQLVIAVEQLRSLSPCILLSKSQIRNSTLNFINGVMLVMAKENDSMRKAVVYLPRYLANKAPEKLEPRSLAVEAIGVIVKEMELDDQIGFADYVVRMTKGKPKLRMAAVDLLLMLLTVLPDPFGLEQEERNELQLVSWGFRCFEALIQRCSDSVGGVRARALSNIAQMISSLSENVKKQIKTNLMETMTKLNEVLMKRCADERAAVRKAALLLMVKSSDILGTFTDENMLQTLGMSCSDPLVSIRKAGLSAISEVFQKITNKKVVKEWLHSVPRLITDNESSIQEECENLFLELVLNRIAKDGCSCLSTKSCAEVDQSIPETVLTILEGLHHGEVSPYVRKICENLGKKKKLKPGIVIALQNIIETSETIFLCSSKAIDKWTAPHGAWFLLSVVSTFLSKSVRWDFLHHYWKLLDNNIQKEAQTPITHKEMEGTLDLVALAGDRVYILQTISNVSLELPPEPAADLAHELLQRIEEFNMHFTEVNAHVKALRTLCKKKAVDAEGDSLISKWVHQLLFKAQHIIEKYLSEISEAAKTSGYLTPQQTRNRKAKNGIAGCIRLSQATTAVFTVGSLIFVNPSADLKGIIPLLHSIITSGNLASKRRELEFVGLKVSVKEVAPSLYIQSWITMGKICLGDSKLAKRYIPLFVQELEMSELSALRNNIVVIMADFCVRYTALVDGYIPRITYCLRDTCEVVRRQTFILLARLLQRDYVKWRGVLFLRFLLCLVDESMKIRQLADFLFGNILKAKAPLLAYNSFVEAIFVLNDCQLHSGYNNSQSARTERQLFSIWGKDEKSRSQRMHIYVSLLKQMAPEHLLATSAKLCAEILAAASDGFINVDDARAQCVLQDALQILSCKEMRIQDSKVVGTSEEVEMDEEGPENGGYTMATRGRMVTQVAKKNLIQNAVPIFIELKRLLESKKSPVTGCLMECLRVLLKDYKNEIDEILVADKQLQKELLYDINKYESSKVKSTATVDVPDIQRSILKEVNSGTPTPPLHSMNLPKLKASDRSKEVLESLRRRL